MVVLAVVIFGLFWISWKLNSVSGVKVKKTQTAIGFSLGVTKEERWLKDKDLFVEKARELGASVTVLMTDQDVDMQISQIRNLIAQKVKVIVIVPSDFEKLVPVIEEARLAGIKTIAYDRLIMSEYLDLYVSFDNVKVGVMEAEAVLDRIDRKGKIAYIGGSPTDNNAYLVKSGSMSVLQKLIDNGSVELVIDEFMDNWDPTQAYNTIKAYLEEGAELDGIIAANDGTAFGSINALKEFGLAGSIPVSGQDAELAACQRIVEGTQTMTVYKPIRALAHKTAELAVAMANNEIPETNNFVMVHNTQIPAFLIEPTVVNNETMEETVIRDRFYSYEEVYGELR